MSVKGVGTALWLAIAGAIGFFPSIARADRIDGEWCHGTSSFMIEGPHIVTPGGSQIQGLYTRHSFTYVVPASEPDAGSEVKMLLLNEEALQLIRAGGAQPEIWQRCKVTS